MSPAAQKLIGEFSIPHNFIPVFGENIVCVNEAIIGLLNFRRSLDTPSLRVADVPNVTPGERLRDARIPPLRANQRAAADSFLDENGHIRSGIMHAMCGFGKTVVTGHLLSHLKGAVLIVVPTSIAQDQWIAHLREWGVACSTAAELNRCKFNSTSAVVLTYAMLTSQVTHSADVAASLRGVLAVVYDALVLDEAHKVPAPVFRTVCHTVFRVRTIGLTATLSRLDGLDKELPELIGGGTLFSHNDQVEGCAPILTRLAIKVPLHERLQDDWKTASGPRKQVLSALNPNKIGVLLQILKDHEGSKFILFCDWRRVVNVLADIIATEEGTPLTFGPLSGTTKMEKRRSILKDFKESASGILIVTSVGELALNVPDLNVSIEITSNRACDGAAQRIGRVMRSAPGKDRAFSYVILTEGAAEVSVVEERDRTVAQKRDPAPISADHWSLISKALTHQHSQEQSRTHRAPQKSIAKRVGIKLTPRENLAVLDLELSQYSTLLSSKGW